MNYTKKNIKNQIRGKANRAVGEMFENYISAACIHYELTGQAMIEKTPEPMRVVRNIGGGKFISVFDKKAQPDYKGTLINGKSIVFEAKHTDDSKIQQSRVTDIQTKGLDKHELLGAKCFVMVSIQMQKFYLVPWNLWKNMKSLYNHKHMTTQELEKHRVPFKNGIIDFLNNI